MVKLVSTVLYLAIAAVTVSAHCHPSHSRFLKRQASSSLSHSHGSHTLAAASTTASSASASASATPTPSFTGSIPASILSIVTTISSGQGDTTATQPLYTTYPAGAKNPQITNAPVLPDFNTIKPSSFPALDVISPTNSPQIQKWMSKIDWSKVPNVTVTTNSASCASNPANKDKAGEDGNCWWTCGGCSRQTDITTCPDQNTWGLSYDDGPSPYTPQLLEYLEQHHLKSTFFIVGSRAISRPQMLQTEYMAGHQISVHTWSHPALTTLTNAEIVSELGWTKHVIRTVLGVTPNTMRPPYGDIDDRVRAISMQMGLTPIIWTSTGPNDSYDTNDWKIGAGTVSAAQVVYNFEQIINKAPTLKTGYIVLAHDLYQQSVELATQIVLPLAQNMKPKQNIMPIVQCLRRPDGDAYVETYRNNSGLAPYQTASATSATSTGAVNSKSGATRKLPTLALLTVAASFTLPFLVLL